MEKDDEVKGNGNYIDFGARGYDPRIGRWHGVDPLTHKCPSLSSYSFAANMPIIAIDVDGRDIWLVVTSYANNLSSITNPLSTKAFSR
jgi:RHS repeat-associated protein